MTINKTLKAILPITLIFFVGSIFVFNWSAKHSKPPTFYQNAAGIDFANKSDFNNCIVLEKDKAVLIISYKTTNLSYNNLKKDLSNAISTIKEQELKIIMTKESDYNDVVTVLKVISDGKIKNYKLLKS